MLSTILAIMLSWEETSSHHLNISQRSEFVQGSSVQAAQVIRGRPYSIYIALARKMPFCGNQHWGYVCSYYGCSTKTALSLSNTSSPTSPTIQGDANPWLIINSTSNTVSLFLHILLHYILTRIQMRSPFLRFILQQNIILRGSCWILPWCTWQWAVYH